MGFCPFSVPLCRQFFVFLKYLKNCLSVGAWALSSWRNPQKLRPTRWLRELYSRFHQQTPRRKGRNNRVNTSFVNVPFCNARRNASRHTLAVEAVQGVRGAISCFRIPMIVGRSRFHNTTQVSGSSLCVWLCGCTTASVGDVDIL